MTVQSSNVQGVTETHSVFSLVTMLSLLLLLLLLLEMLLSQVTRVHELCPQGHSKAFTQRTGPGLSNFGSHVLRIASGSGLPCHL